MFEWWSQNRWTLYIHKLLWDLLLIKRGCFYRKSIDYYLVQCKFYKEDYKLNKIKWLRHNMFELDIDIGLQQKG